MRNLLLGAICFFLFAVAFCLAQISCSKIEAQSPTSQPSSINKILVSQYLNPRFEFTIMNYDGTGVQVIDIPLPAGFQAPGSFSNTALSNDGTKIFFTGRDAANPSWGVYSCDTSGTNLTRIRTFPVGVAPEIGGTY